VCERERERERERDMLLFLASAKMNKKNQKNLTIKKFAL